MITKQVSVNSISGGRTSTYMAVHYPTDVNIFACVCIDSPKAAPKDKAVLNYCLEKLNGNFIASAEDEKTLRVVMQLEQLLGKEIVWVRGKSFDHIIKSQGCLPTRERRFCTSLMKILPIFEYCYFRYGVIKENIGIRYDESWRAYELDETEVEVLQPTLFGEVEGKKVLLKAPKLKVYSLMKDYAVSQKVFGNKLRNRQTIYWADKSYPMVFDRTERPTINKYWSTKPEFDFPDDSNCKGCHHKNKFQIKKNYTVTPEILEWFASQERLTGHTWHDDQISYDDVFNMEFTDDILFAAQSCNTGYCLVD